MKKILLLLFCVTFLSGVFAQSFSLYYENGESIPAGATVQFIGDPADEVIVAYVHIKNDAAEAKDVKVKKVIAAGDTLAGTVNTFCWGLCFPPTTYVSPFEQTLEPGATSDLFYGDYNPHTVIGISKIMYVFFDINNVNDSVAVTVEYNASPASIGDELLSLVKFSDAYPNPAINVVNVDYSIPGTVNHAEVVISNMLGSKVKAVELNDFSGKARIEVSELLNGIYFYSLIADDQLILTRKFVIGR